MYDYSTDITSSNFDVNFNYILDNNFNFVIENNNTIIEKEKIAIEKLLNLR